MPTNRDVYVALTMKPLPLIEYAYFPGLICVSIKLCIVILARPISLNESRNDPLAFTSTASTLHLHSIIKHQLLLPTSQDVNNVNTNQIQLNVPDQQAKDASSFNTLTRFAISFDRCVNCILNGFGCLMNQEQKIEMPCGRIE